MEFKVLPKEGRNIQASFQVIQCIPNVLGTIHTHLAFCFAFVHITCIHLFCVHGPPLTQIAPHAWPLPLPPSFLTAASSFPRSHPPSERVSSVPVALQPNFHCLCLFFSSQNYLCLIVWIFIYLFGLLFYFLPSLSSPLPSLLTRPTRQCLSQSKQLRPLHYDNQFQHVSRGGSH